MDFEVKEEIAHYEPALRDSWEEGGSWPHANHYHFHEAVVAAHFVLRGYQVLREFSSTRPDVATSPLASASTRLLHEVVGPEMSAFFRGQLAAATRHGSGEPDLFVFRVDRPNDPKVKYVDPREWFFVEVKGPGDRVGPKQKAFWREVATRFGSTRIRLFRTVPFGEDYETRTIEY